ncbi:MAG: serine/threonine-protein kinase [Bacteroidales bacterium]|nr:serine/threonine-protein kinase [Bacteroidales bacterium]
MQAYFLKGSNAKYFFFPFEESTVLSRSKFSIVYLAAETKTKQKVICKQLSPNLFNNQSDKLKFFVEASISMRHPGIVKTIDLVVEDENIFIIQEFIAGLTLEHLIKDKRLFDYKYNHFFMKVIAKCCEALDHIHKNEYCHCDIKPANIMVLEKYGEIDFDEPEVKIIDLGNIKPAFKPRVFDNNKRTYNILYGSPEQIFGFDELIGDHSDIFSLGLVLYETIAKEPALNTSNPMLIKRLQAVTQVPKHYRIDEDVYHIISKASTKPKLIKSTSKYSQQEIIHKIVLSLQARYQKTLDMKEDILSLIK